MDDTAIIRRIVTGHDESGRSCVLSDSPIPSEPVAGVDARFALIWKTVSSPVNNDDDTDRASEKSGLSQAGGSILRVVVMAPGHRSPMHRTNSLDYGIVLAGEVDLELDNGEITHLDTGDIVVQRGTIHAWINRGTTDARMAFVLLDATPATVAGRALEAR